MRTGNIFAPVGGTSVNESADLLGMQVRLTNPDDLSDGPNEESPGGANFPHQIVAANTIEIKLFCRADDYELSIDRVRVTGWKTLDNEIQVSYILGKKSGWMNV